MVNTITDHDDEVHDTENYEQTTTKLLPSLVGYSYDLRNAPNFSPKIGVMNFRRREKNNLTFYPLPQHAMNNNKKKCTLESLDMTSSTNDMEASIVSPPQVSYIVTNDEVEIICQSKSIDCEDSCDLCHMTDQISTDSTPIKLLFGATGIYISYLFYGHIQEDLFLYQSPYSGDKFHFSWMLQALESLVIVSFGFMLMLRFDTDMQSLPRRKFFQSGVSQVMSKTFTSLSLSAGLSYPVCTLAKSAKIIPVMIGQIFLGGSNKYTTRDYVFAALLVTGTAILSMNTGHGNSSTKTSTFAGVLWIASSLVMDGVTAGLQKRLQIETTHAAPKTLDYMLLTNMSMGAIAFVVSVLLPTTSSSSLSTTSELIAGLTFLHENRDCRNMVMKLCCCSAIGQTFIFYVIANFDPLVCSTITTTRKIMSVLWSVIMKGHIVSIRGQFGIVLAIAALIMEIYDKLDKPRNKSKQATTTNVPSITKRSEMLVRNAR